MISRRLYTFIASASAGAALCTGAPAQSPGAQAAATDHFTVIAYSPASGATGWANNATALEEATHIALGNCLQYGQGCAVATWARNGCAALAVGSGRWGADWGTSPTAAQNAALAKVRSGRIIEVRCTG